MVGMTELEAAEALSVGTEHARLKRAAGPARTPLPLPPLTTPLESWSEGGTPADLPTAVALWYGTRALPGREVLEDVDSVDVDVAAVDFAAVSFRDELRLDFSLIPVVDWRPKSVSLKSEERRFMLSKK